MKYKATVTFSHNGEFIPALCKEISFCSIAGAKKSFIGLLNRMEETLRYNYGSGKQIIVTARCAGASVDLITYKYTTI